MKEIRALARRGVSATEIRHSLRISAKSFERICFKYLEAAPEIATCIERELDREYAERHSRRLESELRLIELANPSRSDGAGTKRDFSGGMPRLESDS